MVISCHNFTGLPSAELAMPLTLKTKDAEKQRCLPLIKVCEACTLTILFQYPSYNTFGEGNGDPLQYSWLENPMDEGAWWAAVHGVAESWTQLKQLSSNGSIQYFTSFSLPPGHFKQGIYMLHLSSMPWSSPHSDISTQSRLTQKLAVSPAGLCLCLYICVCTHTHTHTHTTHGSQKFKNQLKI